MRYLSDRIEALERRTSKDESIVLFIVGLQPGDTKQEITNCHDKNGQTWSREVTESEEAFKERVKREILKSGHGVGMVFCFPPSGG